MNSITRYLPKSLKRLKRLMFPSYEFIAIDISSNCNLRCPFCVNDFSNINSNTLMREPTLDKILTLLPLISGCNFFFSCLFEPTIHPKYIDFLERIPSEHSEKVFFTTNLARPMSDQDIERLSRLRIGNINISLDSLVPDVYESLRKGAKFDIFIDNLDRLASVFNESPDNPSIRFITVVLQKNFKEIQNIIEICHEKYLPISHELRAVYQVAHLNMEWRRENLISNDDWTSLKKEVGKRAQKCTIVQPGADYYSSDNAPYSRKSTTVIETYNPLAIKIDSSGKTNIPGLDGIEFDIDDIDDPYSFFSGKTREFMRSIYSSMRG